MFVFFLTPVAFRRAHVYLRYTSKCLFAHSGVQHILCSVWLGFSSSCVPVMLPGSLDCQFLIAPSVFSNVYISTEKL
jgi:hypothetical protein